MLEGPTIKGLYAILRNYRIKIMMFYSLASTLMVQTLVPQVVPIGSNTKLMLLGTRRGRHANRPKPTRVAATTCRPDIP